MKNPSSARSKLLEETYNSIGGGEIA